MLVEDDNNLREIYEARLLAEGYEIVSAEDGEQALALAVKEKPDLIISDVMMPKISGFDMLDILRSTPETRDTKVVMMTALSQAEDKARADKLGADRYLVKSQVTLEEVAKVAREVLNDENTVPAATITATAPAADPAAAGATVAVTPDPAGTPAPVPAPDPAAAVTPAPEPTAMPVATPPADPQTTVPDPAVTPDPAASTTPTSDPGGSSPVEPPKAQTTAPNSAVPPTVASESAAVEQQIKQFEQTVPDQAGQAEPTAATPASLPEKPGTDQTNLAADAAADMANTVNDLLQKPSIPSDTASKAAPALAPEESSSHIAGKKVIKPINDINTSKGPDLNALLAKEVGVAAAPVTPQPTPATPPAEMPVAEAPAAAGEEQVAVKTPGNVVAPEDPNHPNNIAL